MRSRTFRKTEGNALDSAAVGASNAARPNRADGPDSRLCPAQDKAKENELPQLHQFTSLGG
jgi:hypothetical protein